MRSIWSADLGTSAAEGAELKGLEFHTMIFFGLLSVAKDLVGAQPLTASIQGSSFKVTMTSEFSDENNEKGETGESDASVL